MTASRPTLSALWSSGTARLHGKRSTLRIHSWLPHGALNGSNGWTHNLEAREFADSHPPMEGQEMDWKRGKAQCRLLARRQRHPTTPARCGFLHQDAQTVVE